MRSSIFLVTFLVLIACTFALVSAQQYEQQADAEAAAEFKFKDLWKKIKEPLREIGKDKLKDLINKVFESEEMMADAETESYGDMSVSTLRRIMPGLSESRASQLIGHLNSAMNEASITTCPRKAAFLAQLAHESGQLQWFEEFASGAAYEGRKDLCNTHTGDGKKFKGRGPIQLTGRCNYTKAGQALGLDLVNNPAQVATFSVGFRTSAWFWNTRSLNTYADQNTQASFDTITRRINGGLNGKADRDKYWKAAKSVLGC